MKGIETETKTMSMRKDTEPASIREGGRERKGEREREGGRERENENERDFKNIDEYLAPRLPRGPACPRAAWCEAFPGIGAWRVNLALGLYGNAFVVLCGRFGFCCCCF